MAMGNNPIMMIDPDGGWYISAGFDVLTAVSNAAAVLGWLGNQAWQNRHNPGYEPDWGRGQYGIRLVPVEGGGTKEELLDMIRMTVRPENRQHITTDGNNYLVVSGGNSENDPIFKDLQSIDNILKKQKRTLDVAIGKNVIGDGKDQFVSKVIEDKKIRTKDQLPYIDNPEAQTKSYINPEIFGPSNEVENSRGVGQFNIRVSHEKNYLSAQKRIIKIDGKNLTGEYQVLVHSGLSRYARVETFGHEFYSHAFRALQGKPMSHSMKNG